jgi:hypothetical protein
MDGEQPARVPDAVIAEIRSRENRAGWSESFGVAACDSVRSRLALFSI